MLMRIAFLGPAATFTEAALLQLIDSGAVAGAVGAPVSGAGFAGAPVAGAGGFETERVPVASADLGLVGVASGEFDAAVVPIENSLEGGVPATLDALTNAGHVRILAETVVRVTFVLAALPGVELGDVAVFSTHPHAEAQTRVWTRANLPDAEYLPAPSTAAAAQKLGPGAQYQAVICPELAARTYGLEVLAHDIGSMPNAMTRFVLVGPAGTLPQPTGADKTTIVATLSSDRAGALLELLEQFSARQVNLSRIESRPTGDGLGLYKFSIDISGHASEPRVAEALAGVYRVARKVQFLGSYPAADQVPVEVDPTTTSAVFDEARRWVEGILGA